MIYAIEKTVASGSLRLGIFLMSHDNKSLLDRIAF